MNKYLLLIILLVTGLTGARAQYDSQLSQYFMALGYYNPAYAGVTGDLNMLALSRLQYVGIDGAPTSFFIKEHLEFFRISEFRFFCFYTQFPSGIFPPECNQTIDSGFIFIISLCLSFRQIKRERTHKWYDKL